MSDQEVNLDLARGDRVGLEEAIFCEQKSDQQIEVILKQMRASGKRCLLTRLEAASYTRISPSHRALIDYDSVSKTAFYAWQSADLGDPKVAIVTAGSADVPVAREALRTLEYFGVGTQPVFDVGVAGLWRLLDRIDDIKRFRVVIVVAGMDAALPSVLGGLYPGLIIAVPSSVGYGVAAGGHTALHAMLASCAPGIVTVNIDNGYGAACAALRMLQPAHQAYGESGRRST